MEKLQQKLTELHNLVNEIDENNEKKALLRDQVLQIIKDNGLEKKKFSIGNRTIRYKMDKSLGSITQAYLKQALKDFHNNDSQAQDAYQYVLENRPITERETLEILKKTEK